MSLHCPATMHLVPVDGDESTLAERAGDLADQRIAAVWSGPDKRAVTAAARLASLLGVSARVREGLAEPESTFEALASIADEFRGEHVAVVGEFAPGAIEVGGS